MAAPTTQTHGVIRVALAQVNYTFLFALPLGTALYTYSQRNPLH